MSEGNAIQSEQMICRVTKRSAGRETTGEKVFRELERLGISATIMDCLWKAQEKRTELQDGMPVQKKPESLLPAMERDNGI